jgi:hypothetical protein
VHTIYKCVQRATIDREEHLGLAAPGGRRISPFGDPIGTPNMGDREADPAARVPGRPAFTGQIGRWRMAESLSPRRPAASPCGSCSR